MRALTSFAIAFAAAAPVASADPVPVAPAPVTVTAPYASPFVSTTAIGSSLFALSYLGAVYAASDTPRDAMMTTPHRDALLVPVVGPFLAVGGERTRIGSLALVCDGAAQVAGIGAVVYELVTHARHREGGRRYDLAPLVAGDTRGLAVWASF